MPVHAPILSVLDQSPIFEGMTPDEALRRTVELAKATESLGYHRFWVSEHHNSRAFASASPEILVATIATATQRLRVGSWSALSNLAQPFKVAEQLRMLEALFPGRIDVGLGRAAANEPGTRELQRSLPEISSPHAQLDTLLAYLAGSPVDGEVMAMPSSNAMPQVWMLGASVESAMQAARLGLPYAFGSFINSKHFAAALAAYRETFVPSRYATQPRTMVAVHALCAGTRAQAEVRGRQAQRWFVDTHVRGRNVAFPLEKSCAGQALTGREQLVLDVRRDDEAIGCANECADWLCDLATQHLIDEFAIITITESHEEKVESYARLAAAMAARGSTPVAPDRPASSGHLLGSAVSAPAVN